MYHNMKVNEVAVHSHVINDHPAVNMLWWRGLKSIASAHLSTRSDESWVWTCKSLDVIFTGHVSKLRIFSLHSGQSQMIDLYLWTNMLAQGGALWGGSHWVLNIRPEWSDITGPNKSQKLAFF